MSMARIKWPLLSFFLPVSSLAGQPSTASLAPRLAQTLPACAHACVQAFIAEDFPTSSCSSSGDIGCLCTSDSASGFTLGEGSLRCVAADCSDLNEKALGDVYEICGDISGAKPMTHGTLTATDFVVKTASGRAPTPTTAQRSTTTSFRHSNATSLASISSTHSSSSSRRPTTESTSDTSNTVSMTSTKSSSFSHSSTSSSSNPPSSTAARISSTSYVSTSAGPSTTRVAAAAAAQPVLTKPQIAGITVAGVAAAVITFGVFFFIFRTRRRRSNKRDSGSTFGGDRIIPSHPGSPASYHPVGTDFAPGHGSGEFDHLESQDGHLLPDRTDAGFGNSWSRGDQPGGLHVVMDPGMQENPAVNGSPSSFKSTRTNSGLLPDKPIYSLYPAPLRINHSVSPESPAGSIVPGAAGIGHKGTTPLSKAAPRNRNSSNTSQLSLQRDLRGTASDPFLDSHSDPSASPYARQVSQNPRSRVSDKNWPTNPGLLNHGQWTQSLNNLRKPVPARQSSSARTLNRQKAEYASTSPSDYTGRPVFDFSIPPPEPRIVPRKPVPRRRSAPRRPATQYSSASETSFEDAGDDEGVPTTHPILPPVAESRAVHFTRGQITHPQVAEPIQSQYESRPEPVSPTRRPARRKQPPPPIISASAPRPLKSSLKPLPKVPGNSDSSTPLLSSQHNDFTPTPTISDARSSPRGETELTRSAKWKILVSPGLQGLDNTGTPRSGRSSEWTPNTPTRRDVR